MIDASVLVAALIDNGADGRWAEACLQAHELHAPELVLVETTAALRRLEAAKRISSAEASFAMQGLLDLEIHLLPFAPFAERIWELRSNVTSYDAWYVAVAEALRCPLATLDARLSRASGTACEFEYPRQ